jgi:hypothetical protein
MDTRRRIGGVLLALVLATIVGCRTRPAAELGGFVSFLDSDDIDGFGINLGVIYRF